MVDDHAVRGAAPGQDVDDEKPFGILRFDQLGHDGAAVASSVTASMARQGKSRRLSSEVAATTSFMGTNDVVAGRRGNRLEPDLLQMADHEADIKLLLGANAYGRDAEKRTRGAWALCR